MFALLNLKMVEVWVLREQAGTGFCYNTDIFQNRGDRAYIDSAFYSFV